MNCTAVDVSGVMMVSSYHESLETRNSLVPGKRAFV